VIYFAAVVAQDSYLNRMVSIKSMVFYSDSTSYQSPQFTGCGNFWSPGLNYFRLDGSTPALERERLINAFNADFSVKLFLVSTRAGVSQIFKPWNAKGGVSLYH
jgi:hypothetical protein